jgi:predicted acetyltransferase
VQVRPLTPEEVTTFVKYEQEAFVIETPGWAEEFARDVISPRIENTRALVNDEGELLAVLNILKPKLWLGSSGVLVGAISAVATPPEYRRQGGIKILLAETLKQLREEGINISALYPFYFPFYKKFGYELAGNYKRSTVQISQLAKYRSQVKGRWKQFEPDDWPLFNEMYERTCSGKFSRLTRDERWWRRYMFRGPNKIQRQAYIWYNELGEMRAYLLYHIHTIKDWDREMRIREMVWFDLTARNEVLAFIANHDSQAKAFSFISGTDDSFFDLVDDPREVEEKIEPGYMLRILDVERALAERPWPHAVNAAFKLSVRDELLEWNSGTYRVEVSGGKAGVERISGSDEAGLSCDIRQLNQLYAGYLSPVKLAELGLLETRNQTDLMMAQALFSPAGQPASYMADFF